MGFDAPGLIAVAAVIVALAAAGAIVRARSVLAMALMAAVFAAALAVALLALAAPDMALAAALLGIGFVPLVCIGALVLTAPSVQAGNKKLRIGALLGALAVGAMLAWSAPGKPPVAEGQGRVYVGRAAGETGVHDAVAAIAGNYRALDTLAQIGALMSAALVAYALLAFGERGGRARKPEADA